ncbi:tail fiber domain-containing protein [Flavilitoribacter nigricans]|uniref:tail fiber domain-containing protein n=1 Tax=Flavilitoribacter nigricans TaxID=70997 RepID=UPI0014759E1D|nr:tail fiber domain-containing protein [Flavilitoribacter nigricans]
MSPEALLHVRGESIIQDENKLLTLRSNGDNAFLAYEYRGGFSGANIGYFYDVGEPYYYIDMPDGLFGEFIMLTDGRIFQNGSLIHSDRRLKSDIQPIHNSMSTIQQLRGVSFRYKSEYTKGQKSASEPTIGLIAQEVEEVLPQLVQERPDGYKAVNYTGLIPLLIEAAKEQQKEIQRQQQQISELTSEVTELRALVEQLLTGQNQTPVQNPVREPKPQARLSQNFPNPFHEDTQVDYFLPENVQNARLDIYTVAGKLIESIPLSQSGNGVITFRAGRLPAGTYLYSLVSGDVVLDTKRMILTH